MCYHYVYFTVFTTTPMVVLLVLEIISQIDIYKFVEICINLKMLMKLIAWLYWYR
jgi:hypothetical protein